MAKWMLPELQPTVWWMRTDRLDDACQHRLGAILDQTEHVRAGRFVSAQDRREFVACHALLRVTLFRIAGRSPHEWMFSLGPHGKPSIAADHELPDLQFNIAHTRGLVAVALAWRHPIGVDVQIVESFCDQADLASRFFAPAEAELVGSASKLHRPRVFTQLWTLKEAYIKAIGAGLSAPLDSFAFNLEPLRVQFREESEDLPADWQFSTSAITERHVLSVAVHLRKEQAQRVTLSEVSGVEMQTAIARSVVTAGRIATDPE
ncbi:MAG: 4'-phosphopantetheinyl transferase superfamily protein [Bradyrhizobium sp.]|nr:4'-phosphopantetheinyl transferase superfamily protein [Bradyrhizobium sp.]